MAVGWDGRVNVNTELTTMRTISNTLTAALLAVCISAGASSRADETSQGSSSIKGDTVQTADGKIVAAGNASWGIDGINFSADRIELSQVAGQLRFTGQVQAAMNGLTLNLGSATYDLATKTLTSEKLTVKAPTLQEVSLKGK
jgi:lipopolysaccharide assembly outer membrane protein LptD (OstA)